MRKEIKYYSPLFTREVTFIMDDEWKPEPSKFALRKLEKAVESLSKSKNLDEILKRQANDFSHE
ncbi:MULTISPECIES: hypothetical protein [Niastella]|uniref:Uncharacterized protein n=1 Tax=Niastella soli TaxID=2821487 RepID=A0ABS3Z482_9BACT|nr:hypothetical protein [Niastella soli]MBO9204981.1 hypothetical protein [Niastella soli]